MKPLWKGLTAAALAASLCATGVLAAGHHGRGLRQATHDVVCGVCFTDINGDGVCDYHGTNCGGYFVDADGDGVCDNYGTGLGSHHGGGHGGCRNR